MMFPFIRFFSAARSGPAPELECLVGMDSAVVSELYKVTLTQRLTTDTNNIYHTGEVLRGLEHQHQV